MTSSSVVRRTLSAVLKNKTAPQVSQFSTSCVFRSGDGESSVNNQLPSSTAVDNNIEHLFNAKKGGRAFNGKVATLFGSRGLVGETLVSHMCRAGSQLILPYPGDPYWYRMNKVNGDLGQIYYTPFHLKDEESVRRTMTHSDIVINAIGRHYETRHFSYHDVNVEGPRLMARLARQSGVKRFIHFSSINAREKPAKAFLPGGSKWLKTKWEGEQAVLEEFPDATIFRPSGIFGECDNLVWYYTSYFRCHGAKMPLWNKGENILQCPVYNSDLGKGVIRALELDDTKGEIIEAYGKHYFVLAELVDFIFGLSRQDTYKGRMYLSPLAYRLWLKVLWCELMPFGQRTAYGIVLDTIDKMSLSDEILGYTNLADLGIDAVDTLETILPWCVLLTNTWLANKNLNFYIPEHKRPDRIPIVEGRQFLDHQSSNFAFREI